MEGRLLLKDCAILRPDGRIRDGMAIVVEGELVREVASDDKVPVRPGDWEIACRGRLVSPGFGDCHTHLVNAQLWPLRGERWLLSPVARLAARRTADEALTVAELETLAAYGCARALRAGVTFIAEHLHCPDHVEEGLAAFTRTAQRLGIRALVSHASCSEDRDAPAHVEANAAHAKAVAKDPLVRGALGFEASYCADDAMLQRIADHLDTAAGRVHFHCAESEHDLLASYDRYAERIVSRLERFGLLGPGTVAAFPRAIDRDESDRLARSGALIAISPRMDLLSEPGGGGFEAVFSRQNLVGLATGGEGTLREELCCALIGLVRLARSGRLLDPDSIAGNLVFGAPAELCARAFGHPGGVIEPGCLADLVVHDRVPPKLPEAAPELLLGIGAGEVAWTIVGGRVAVREGELLGADFVELSREAATVASRRSGR